MSKPLAFLPEVPDDIEEARDWYLERNDSAAFRFLATLERLLRLIERYPQQGAFHDERRLYRYRRLPQFPYVVVYREYEERTLIVAVYHTSRHPDHWQQRLR